MAQKTKRIIAGVLAAFFLAGVVAMSGSGIANALSGDSDVPISGNALTQASAAAQEHIGEGRVTDTEVGDEEGYYEVEITLDDGSQVDVHLDKNFNVLDREADSDTVED